MLLCLCALAVATAASHAPAAQETATPKRLLIVSTSTRNRFQNSIDAEIVNPSPKHPASKGIPGKWQIREFSYKIPNFVLSDPAHTQELLIMEKSPTDQTPGHFPLAWCRDYVKGRVFFTSIGGNLDLLDENLANRKNPPETAKIFQAHLLGGILWAVDPNTLPNDPALE